MFANKSILIFFAILFLILNAAPSPAGQVGGPVGGPGKQEVLYLAENDNNATGEELPGEDTVEGSETDAVVGSDADAVEEPGADSTEDSEDLKKELEKIRKQLDILMKSEDVRGNLTQSVEEKEEKEENILNAAGREYTLMQKGRFGFEYSLMYSSFRYDSIKEANVIEHNANHNFKNTFIFEFPAKDNLTIGSRIPFVYAYDQIGSKDEKQTTDFGDVDFYANYQPMKSGGDMPSIILNTYLSCPMGRSPYKINPDKDVSTGTGGYSTTFSVNASKPIDPVLVYGTLSYEYKFPIAALDYKVGPYTLNRYEPGDTIGLSCGFAFALSYNTSLSLGYSYSYTLKSTQYFKEIDPQRYPTSNSASIAIGTSWRLASQRRVNVSLSIGLNNSGSHSIGFQIPMEFNL